MRTKLVTGAAILAGCLALTGCEEDPLPTNTWKPADEFQGEGRYYAVAFSIGKKGYVGTGRGAAGARFDDFWEYNPKNGTWTQKQDFPGGSREHATGFSIGSKGYIATGWKVGTLQKDTWEYNPATNEWAPKDDFGGGIRQNAISFVVNNKAYVGAGTGADQAGNYIQERDLWEFDPTKTAGEQWTQKLDIGGPNYNPDMSGVTGFAFTLGSKGYVALPNGAGQNTDFWEYDPGQNNWTEKETCPFSVSRTPMSFVLKGKGYALYDWHLWRYDAASNTWTARKDFPVEAKIEVSGFVIGKVAYVGLGYVNGGGAPSSDFFKYYP
jgi:N-acetylneuraminic acid mutarotase